MPNPSGLTAVGILLGGASRRMGRPKHELKLPDGRTLLEAMIDIATTLCDTIILCGNGASTCALPRAHDAKGLQGPLAGIESLLRTTVHGRCLVLPCDMPALKTADLQRLIATECPLALFGSPPETRMRSMPLFIDTCLLPQLQSSINSNQLALHEFIQTQPHELVTPPVDETTLVNLNTPEDVQRWITSRGQ